MSTHETPSPRSSTNSPGNAEAAMHLVGAIEILAGIVVLVLPRFGGPLVAAS